MKILSSQGIWPEGLSLIRIIVGIFLTLHGTQATERADMEMFATWLTDMHIPFPLAMAYLGKGAEFFGGICLTVGVFTRIACVFLIITFSFITFALGKGHITTDAQHPFLFLLFSCLFLFQGPGKWSVSRK